MKVIVSYVVYISKIILLFFSNFVIFFLLFIIDIKKYVF